MRLNVVRSRRFFLDWIVIPQGALDINAAGPMPFQFPTTRRDVGVVGHVGGREAGCHSGHHGGSSCAIANSAIWSHSRLEARAIHGSRHGGSCSGIVRQYSKSHHSPIVRISCRWWRDCIVGQSRCSQCGRSEAGDFSD